MIGREWTWALQHHQGATTLLLQETTLGTRIADNAAAALVYLEARAWPWYIGGTKRNLGNVIFAAAQALVRAVDDRTRVVAELPIGPDLADRLDPTLLAALDPGGQP